MRRGLARGARPVGGGGQYGSRHAGRAGEAPRADGQGAGCRRGQSWIWCVRALLPCRGPRCRRPTGLRRPPNTARQMRSPHRGGNVGRPSYTRRSTASAPRIDTTTSACSTIESDSDSASYVSIDLRVSTHATSVGQSSRAALSRATTRPHGGAHPGVGMHECLRPQTRVGSVP